MPAADAKSAAFFILPGFPFNGEIQLHRFSSMMMRLPDFEFPKIANVRQK
jgi:hypothetical protein